MLQRHVRFLPLLPLLGTAAPVCGEPPVVLVCHGHEPEWSLRIDGSAATLATLGATGLQQTGFEGRLQETASRPPSFVYRGSTGTSGADLVAVITREACRGTTSDTAGGGDPSDYAARVSLPDGAVRLGCCSVVPALATPPQGTLSPPAGAAAPASPAPAPAPAPPPPTLAAGRGEITALMLPDGRVCRSTGKGATQAFGGQRLNFDCGTSDGDTLGLVGPLAVDPDGLLAAEKAFVPWRSGEQEPRRTETTPVRVSEISLPDGLVCRFAGAGATLAFEGRRASYTCGMRDGDTVALLGDLEPVEDGFRIVRARVAHAENGFMLRSSETILVDAPR